MPSSYDDAHFFKYVVHSRYSCGSAMLNTELTAGKCDQAMPSWFSEPPLVPHQYSEARYSSEEYRGVPLLGSVSGRTKRAMAESSAGQQNLQQNHFLIVSLSAPIGFS